MTTTTQTAANIRSLIAYYAALRANPHCRGDEAARYDARLAELRSAAWALADSH